MTDTSEEMSGFDAFMALVPPEAIENPYPFYAMLREADPVMFIEPMNAWLLTAHADVATALTDDRFVMGFEQAQRNREGDHVVDQPYFRMGVGLVTSCDPPAHTRIRRVFRQPFTARRVADLGNAAFDITNRLLDEHADSGPVDVIDAMARNIPMQIACRLMGVPTEDEDIIRGFYQALYATVVIDPLGTEGLAAANAAADELVSYFSALVVERRSNPGDDFVSSVIQANAADEAPLSDLELAVNIAGTHFGGYDTQSLSIGLLLATLDGRPDVRRALAEDPGRIPDALPELMRYDTAGQFMPRVASEDVTLGGKQILAGQTLLVSMGAANHDPAVFDQPDRLDLDRMPADEVRAKAMTFGRGRHYCIGSHLAPANLTRMLQAILERFPNFVVHHDQAQRQPVLAARGYESLPVTFAP